MKLLVDTNVALEVLLHQERESEARCLLANTAGHGLHLTSFSLDSIGVILCRRRLHSAFLDFVADMLESDWLRLLTLSAPQVRAVADTAAALSLDFDDAYQYVAAEQHGLDIVSFDPHFDRTPRGRRTPAQALAWSSSH